MKKRLVSALLIFALLISAAPSTLAKQGDIYVTVNGIEVSFDRPPIVEKGRTLVMFRPLFEKLGIEYEWDRELLTSPDFGRGGASVSYSPVSHQTERQRPQTSISSLFFPSPTFKRLMLPPQPGHVHPACSAARAECVNTAMLLTSSDSRSTGSVTATPPQDAQRKQTLPVGVELRTSSRPHLGQIPIIWLISFLCTSIAPRSRSRRGRRRGCPSARPIRRPANRGTPPPPLLRRQPRTTTRRAPISRPLRQST